MEEYTLIYGLQQFNGAVSFYYPEAFIARVKNGKPTYMEKNGTPEVIASFKLPVKDTNHEALISLCESLNPKVLEKNNQGRTTKPKSLSQLFEEPKLKGVLTKRIDDGLKRFLFLIRQSALPFYYQVERKVFLEDIRLKFAAFELKPNLRFEKTSTGTNYFLFLTMDDFKIIPCQHNIVTIVDEPSIIINDHIVYHVSDINSAKLKPFLKNEKVFIPERLTGEYFNKFIKDIIGTTQIEVEGYDFVEMSPKVKTLIRFGEGFFSERIEALLYFQYDKVRFAYGDKAKHKVSINANAANVVSVELYRRNMEDEQKVVSCFLDHGFVESSALRIVPEEEEDNYALLFFCMEHKKKLEALGATIDFPLFDNKTLNTSSSHIEILPVLKNDWFDINAVIKVGDNIIEFAALAHHIKNNQRIYHLSDGTIFIIPLEWMKKYEALARNCFIEDGKVMLQKTKHALLSDLGGSHGEVDGIHTEEDLQFDIPDTIQASLRPYQYEGARWLVTHYKNGLGACLADDMGLGKTLQTLTLLCHVKSRMKEVVESGTLQLSLFDTYTTTRSALQALIVLPSSLVFNWMSEIKKFAPSLMVTIHTGPDRSRDYRALQHFDIILTTYQTLTRDETLFDKISLSYVVLDEAHYIKNRDSNIFKVVKALKTEHRLSLSGTPIENSLADLWSQMDFINPDILHTYAHFKKHYQDAIEKNKNEEVLAELKKLLSPYILRRTKGEVLKDLPDLEEQIFYSVLPPEQSKLIEGEKSKARNALLNINEGEQVGKLQIFNALMRLRQLANHPKLVDVESKVESGKYEDITNTIETLAKSGNKILVFSSFKSHLALYEDFLRSNAISFVVLTGDSSSGAREKAVHQFNEEPNCLVFLISLKAGGVGLNLTSANYVLLLDPWWNPFAEKQAIARAHRIGQKQNVTVIRFIAKDTIEEKILQLQSNKLLLSDQMIDEQMIPEMSEDTLSYLLS